MADYVIFTTQGGETLQDMAAKYTLDPSYYLAIGTYGGFDAFQISPDYHFPAGEKIAIPTPWLKPEYAAAAQVPATTSRGPLTVDITGAAGRMYASATAAAAAIPWGWIAAGGVALVALLMLSRRPRSRARRRRRRS